MYFGWCMIDYQIKRYRFLVVFMIASLLLFTTYVYICILHLNENYILKYSFYCFLGLIVMFIANMKSIHYFISYSVAAYGIVMLLLLIVLFTPAINGSHRWVPLGFINLQPSELVKIILPLFLCRIDGNGKLHKSKTSAMTAVLFIVLTVVFVLLEPDLGTSIFILLEGFICLLLLRVNKFILVSFCILLCILVPVIYTNLKSYQVMRILVFLNSENVPFEHGFQIMQSLATVVSGGWFGLSSHIVHQSEMSFLAHAHTDFIFSIVAQYFGFIGSVFLLTVVFSIVWCADLLSNNSSERLVYALKKTYIYAIVIAVLVNVSMNLAIIPTVGLPFPILSYGGSNFLVSCFMFGIILQRDQEDLYA